MKIVIGEKNGKTIKYAYNIKAILADEMCGIKSIKEDVEIYIPYDKILDNGMIDNTNIYFEEVLITLNVKKVYYRYSLNDYLKGVIKFYHIEFYTNFIV